MATAPKMKSALALTLYRGDAKTLLAFNLPRSAAKNLAGFTIQCQPQGKQPYYIYNELQFQHPGDHAQDPKEPSYSSINAPIHKFRWLHVPGSSHQGLDPFMGKYTYTVTPRYFDAKGSLLPLDTGLSVSKDVDVEPFETGNVALGFTRGYTQSQAFVRHFGLKALIRPAGNELLFDTSEASGKDATGNEYTFKEEYDWLGYTARQRIFALLEEVVSDDSLQLDIFAYDLNEPDLINILLKLAPEGRIRIILDNAALHHTGSSATKSTKAKSTKSKSSKAKGPTAEDQFEALFRKAAKGDSGILRGKFGRYSHDKVFIVSKGNQALKVLTGSTNFSVTGLYVNSNHVLLYNDKNVAGKYAQVFLESWKDGVNKAAFQKSPLSSATPFAFTTAGPNTSITFSPHTAEAAGSILQAMTKRIAQEGKAPKSEGCVLFAVMQIDQGNSPVYDALNALHKNSKIFSYGISDGPKGISLYKPGNKTGVLVTGKPVRTQLPAPFNQVPNIGGIGHQVHHKFVVCGFKGKDPVVYCGSSNLATGGETLNGDNLLAVHDEGVATVFAIEALALVDHFDFLDRCAQGAKATKGKTSKKGKPASTPPALKRAAAAKAGWFLSTDDKWTASYFNSKDLHFVDRELFGQ